MKRSRFSEEQVIAMLKEQEAGVATVDICRKHGVSSATFYKWKALLRKPGRGFISWIQHGSWGCMGRPTPPSYKTKNWPAYNDALKQRGSLTIWFDPGMAWKPPPTGKRGRQPC